MPHIEARPYDFPLPNSPALIVIDMQRDFLEPGGFGASLGNDVALVGAIVPTVKQLLDVFRRLHLPIVHTREAHRPDLSDCPPSKKARGDCRLRIGDRGPMGRLLVDGEAGSAFVEQLKPWPDEIEIVKPGKGAFFATPLDDLLRQRNITHLIFTGVTTEVCVQTTMREANDRGYECLLVEDATASYFPAFKQATLSMIIAQGGIVGWVARSEAVINTLEKIYGLH